MKSFVRLAALVALVLVAASALGPESGAAATEFMGRIGPMTSGHGAVWTIQPSPNPLVANNNA